MKLKHIKFAITVLLLLPSSIYPQQQSNEFSNTKIISFSVNYDMGGIFVGSGENFTRFGGLFGLRIGSRWKILGLNSFNVFAEGDLRYNYMSWSSDKKDTESTGIDEISSLLDLNTHLCVRLFDIEILFGLRKYIGKNNSSYDWWSDYKSNIAWDGRYANYYWSEKNELNLKGNELGIRYYLNLSNGHGGYLELKILRVDMIIEHITFWDLSIVSLPTWGDNGLFGYFEVGNCSPLKSWKLAMGLGYIFSPF